MAGRIGIAQQAAVALAAATVKTVVQVVAAANHAIKIRSFNVSFDGIDNTDEPVTVVLMRQTTAGTMSALTPVKNDDSCGDTLDTTAQHTATAEPTSGDVLYTITVHPQTSRNFVFDPDLCPIVGAGDRVGLVCTAPDAVNVDAGIVFEE